jgi:uncharacterized membrane protein
MPSLLLAAIFFVGIHVVISGTRLRDTIVETTGEAAFRGLFALLSLVGLVWLSLAYAGAPQVELWGPLHALRPVALILTLVAFVLVGLGATTPNPTTVGGESHLDAPPRGVLRVTRHPFLWGVALWALAHLVVNGDAASLVLFGSLLLLALVGPPSIDAKRRRALGRRWEPFAAATSSVPFAAIVQGRNSLELGELGWWRVAVGLALWALLLALHAPLFGVSPFPS